MFITLNCFSFKLIQHLLWMLLSCMYVPSWAITHHSWKAMSESVKSHLPSIKLASQRSFLSTLATCYQLTPLAWLPVLSNIEPPALRSKAATDKLVEKHDSWPIQPDILSPPLLRLTSRKPFVARFATSWHQKSMKAIQGITGSRLRWSILI